MKKISFILGLIIIFGCTQAKNSTTALANAPYNAAQVPPQPNIAHIPSFRILNQDSVYITNANLKKNKAVMIVYFSPDCSHCQRLMHDMKPEMRNFDNVQIVMVTFTQIKMLKMIKDFYHDYSLAGYPNLLIGTEYPNYVLQKYFQVQTTPYIAIYDGKGKLVKAFEKKPEMKDLIAAAKKA
jgi:thioredoxin-related protein